MLLDIDWIPVNQITEASYSDCFQIYDVIKSLNITNIPKNHQRCLWTQRGGQEQEHSLQCLVHAIFILIFLCKNIYFFFTVDFLLQNRCQTGIFNITYVEYTRSSVVY